MRPLFVCLALGLGCARGEAAPQTPGVPPTESTRTTAGTLTTGEITRTQGATRTTLSCDVTPYAHVTSQNKITIAVARGEQPARIEMYLNSRWRGASNQAPCSFDALVPDFVVTGSDGILQEYEFVAYDAAGQECGALSLPLLYSFSKTPPLAPQKMNPSLDAYPQLQQLAATPLHISDVGTTEVDPARLGQGFAILKDGAGTNAYEWPVRLPSPNRSLAFVAQKYAYIALETGEGHNRLDLFGAARPTGTVNLVVPMSALEAYSHSARFTYPEGALSALLTDLPENFLPTPLRLNLIERIRRIDAKRGDGTYLADSDALPDLNALQEQLFYALNIGLYNRALPLGWPQFEFERPFVHVRRFETKAAGVIPGKTTSSEVRDMVRFLNYHQIMGRLYGYTGKEGPVLDQKLGTYPAYTRLAPYPAPDALRFLGQVFPSDFASLSVNAGGSLVFKPFAQTDMWRPYTPPEFKVP